MAKKSANTTLGLEENLEAALSYLGGWITGLIFLIAEKKSKLVRFHALQSIVAFGGLTIVSMVLGMLPFGFLFGWILTVAGIVLWIYCMMKAYKGVKFSLPIVGDFVKKQKL
jgi:uncharacterized membrane protein